MLFATYQPYDWKETVRPTMDYASTYVGKEMMYCIAADTIEEFIIGSMTALPTCPEILVLFEIKHFYAVNKIEHCRFQSAPQLFNSRKFVNLIADKSESPLPYQSFLEYYHNGFNKLHHEFLIPKSRIVPKLTIDVKGITEAEFIKDPPDEDWRESQKAYVDKLLPLWTKNIQSEKEKLRTIRKLEARWLFENFIINYLLIDEANKIYNQKAIMKFDQAVYWKLFDKFNEDPSAPKLDKLNNFIRQSIQYNK